MAIHTSKVSGTTDATAGTRTTIAHGLTNSLGGPLTPDWVGATAIAADANGSITPSEVQVVSYDDTDVVIRAEDSSVDVEIIAIADVHPITG